MGRYDWSVPRDPAQRMVNTLVRVAGRLSKSADLFLKPYRLSLAKFNVLTVLAPHPEGVPQSRIGEALVVSRANVTGLVRKLKRQGLCRTVEDPADARIRRVVLTAAGRRLLERIERPYFREIAKLTRGLGEPEMARAADLLDRIRESIPAHGLAGPDGAER